MADIHIHKQVLWPSQAFKDRHDAGVSLANFLAVGPQAYSIVLALPRGGIPVGEPIAEDLAASLELALVRKLPVPSSPEMGFGAVAIDGNRILNEGLLEDYPLSQDQIEKITETVTQEVRRRAREYVGTDLPPNVRGKDVYMVDDGLATGYSVIAAAKMMRKLDPQSLVLAVPVSPARSITAVEPYFDEIYCLIVQRFPSFAVASFYRDFHDMSDEEVREILARSRQAESRAAAN